MPIGESFASPAFPTNIVVAMAMVFAGCGGNLAEHQDSLGGETGEAAGAQAASEVYPSRRSTEGAAGASGGFTGGNGTGGDVSDASFGGATQPVEAGSPRRCPDTMPVSDSCDPAPRCPTDEPSESLLCDIGRVGPNACNYVTVSCATLSTISVRSYFCSPPYGWAKPGNAQSQCGTSSTLFGCMARLPTDGETCVATSDAFAQVCDYGCDEAGTQSRARCQNGHWRVTTSSCVNVDGG